MENILVTITDGISNENWILKMHLLMETVTFPTEKNVPAETNILFIFSRYLQTQNTTIFTTQNESKHNKNGMVVHVDTTLTYSGTAFKCKIMVSASESLSVLYIPTEYL